eukprot:4599596-Lingulodinium_polyedra.AAC.1
MARTILVLSHLHLLAAAGAVAHVFLTSTGSASAAQCFFSLKKEHKQTQTRPSMSASFRLYAR